MESNTDQAAIEQARALLQSRMDAARAAGAAAAISAMFNHLGLPMPLVIDQQAIRREGLVATDGDMGAFLDPEATAALDTVAALVKDYGPIAGPAQPSTLYEDEATVHYEFPPTGRQFPDPSLDNAGSFDV